MKKRIAFFDFDGTITTKDTFLEVIKYQKGLFRFYAGLLLNIHYILAWKTGLLPNYVAKQKVLRFYFGNTPLETFQQRCDAFENDVLPGLIRPKALKEIERLKQAGAEVVIVSASPGHWSRQWRDGLQLQSLMTRLEVKDGKLTGRFDGKNCHGEEKVCRIRDEYDLSSYDEIYCYGDSKGDMPMLKIATISFYRPFR
ncbi:MAG: HAD-IB family hydrolase [Chitinophagaceae bacterium]